MGVPLATDHVSHGGEKIVAVTLPDRICDFQNWIVEGFVRSLCGASSLDRSIEMGNML